MKNTHISSKKTTIPKALLISLTVCAIVGFFGMFFAYTPDFHSPHVINLIIVWALAFIIGAASFSFIRRPSWLASTVFVFCLSTLFLLGAIHTLSPYLAGWLWIVILVAAFILFWTMPLLMPRITKTINLKQRRARIRFDRPTVMIGVVVVSAITVGLLGSQATGSDSLVMLCLGTSFASLALVCSQTYAYKAWEERKKEIQSHQEIE